jgi:hypothetical protein
VQTELTLSPAEAVRRRGAIAKEKNMASKHMQRGRQYLCALERYEKAAKDASEHPKTQPESSGTVDKVDSKIKEMSSSDLGIALSNARKMHLKKDGTRKLFSFGKIEEFKRLQQLEAEWKQRLKSF